MTTFEEFFSPTNPPVDPLRNDLIDMIEARYRATPRNMQIELGPSEVSHPCMRKMAYGIMEVERCNPEYDPLPSIVGTASHTWMQSAAWHANNILGRERWLTETKVHVTPGLSGSADLYDMDNAVVVDYKFPGTTRFDRYVKDPGPQYKLQVHFYGRGFENAGLPVKQVAIAFLPRGGMLRNMHIWKEDYNPALVDAGLRKRDAVINLIADLDVEHHPERYQWIPEETYDCVWCPWFRPVPRTGLQCRGDQ